MRHLPRGGAKKFSSNPHARLALEHGGKGISCEGCHGPGKAHVDGGGDVTKIRQFEKLSSAQIDETCLTCHAGKHPNFERSRHAEQGVTCLNCHSVHHSESKADLLKVEQPLLCFTCHKNVSPAFSQAFHHLVNEGLMNCSDCHDPHGTFQPQQLRWPRTGAFAPTGTTTTTVNRARLARPCRAPFTPTSTPWGFITSSEQGLDSLDASKFHFPEVAVFSERVRQHGSRG
jgi:DmsE family decaheme c-type cytochrome